MWAHYAAEAELIDRWMGRVLQKIDDLGLWEDTIVAITSDHGMSIGEHARTGKSNIHDGDERYWPIYPEIGHVPFLLAGGGVPQGQQLDLIAQPIDILPTLSDLAGVSVEAERPIQGRSFAGAVLNGTEQHREYAVSGCFIHSEGDKPPYKATTPFMVAGQWGYTPVGAYGLCELYDLDADPLAEHNVAAEHPEQIVHLHEVLLAHLHDHGASESTLDLWHEMERAGGRGRWAIDYPNRTV
jgi:arylsulfatase A-like enzyme